MPSEKLMLLIQLLRSDQHQAKSDEGKCNNTTHNSFDGHFIFLYLINIVSHVGSWHPQWLL